jgi:hypothetical protein|eukprot:COSAG02_NODE_477_length_21523_cov_11.763163_17_plen_44_part_00
MDYVPDPTLEIGSETGDSGVLDSSPCEEDDVMPVPIQSTVLMG